MKIALKWIGIILISPIALFLILLILLYLPPVQNWAVDKVAEVASRETGMQISVSRVGLHFPLDLNVEGVSVVRQTDTVADIGRVVVSVQLLPLFGQQVVVDQLEINHATVNTVDFISDLQVRGQVGRLAVSSRGIDLREGAVELNGAFLEDADLLIQLSDTAAVDTTTSETPWLIRVDSVMIARSRVDVHMPGDSMQVQAYLGRVKASNGVFDLLASRYTVQHFDWREGALNYQSDERYEVTGIGIGLDSLYYCSPELMLKVRDAAMKEKSGLELTKLNGRLMMDSVGLRLPNLNLQTPYSYIRARASVDFNVMDSIQPGRMDVDVEASLGKQDMVLFLSNQHDLLRDRWPEWPLDLKVRAKGNRNRAEIEKLDITLPTAFHAEAVGVAGLPPAPIDLDVKAQSYELGFLSAILPGYGKDYRLPNGLRLQGDVKTSGPSYAANLLLSDGEGLVRTIAHFNDLSMSYDADVDVRCLNLHRFLPSQSLGLLSARVNAKGKGFDFFKTSSWMEADAHIGQLQYGNYDLDSLHATAWLHDGHAQIGLNGHNQLMDGMVQADALLSAKKLQATIGADLNRLNLYALELVEKPLSVGACGHVDLESNLKEQHYVSALFTELYIRDSLRTYRPEDVGLLLRSNRDTTLARLQSGNLIVKLDASGGIDHLAGQLEVLSDSLTAQWKTRTIDQPQIKRLLPTMRLYVTSGSDNPIATFLRSSANFQFKNMLFDFSASPAEGINGTAFIHQINADSTRIDTVRFSLVEKKNGMTFNGQVTNDRRNPQFVFNTLFDGRMQEHGASFGVRFFDKDGNLGLRLGAQAEMVEDGIRFHLIPKNPTIGYKLFTLNDDNFLTIQNNLRLKAKVDLIADDGTGIKIYSVDQDSTLLQDLTVSLHRIDLGQLTDIIPYVPRITGELNGDYHLVMNEQRQISMASDMNVDKMTYENSHIGNISTEFVYLQRENDTHAVEGRLMLEGTEVANIRGEYRDAQAGFLDANMQLTKFPLELVNGFIPDQLIGFEGYVGGQMSVLGTSTNLDVNGEALLDSAALISVPYGVRMRFHDVPLRVSKSRLLFDDFTMYSSNDEPLSITGNIDFHNTDRATMDMRMQARNFQIINSKQTSKSIAYGKAFVNFFARMNGRLSQLRMRGRLDVLGSTDLTYILLDSPLSTDNRMDELVKFADFSDSVHTTIVKPTPTGFDADLTLSIDQGAHVRCALNVDQTNFVDLFGGGDLRMKYNVDGISMTGRYTMTSGEMKYSLPVIPLKTFTIQSGSYVEFTGEPSNPTLNLTATERIRAAVGQQGQQSRSVAFDCGVVITKTLNDMGLEFIISAPEDNSVANELSTMSTEQRGKLAVTMLTTGMYLADGNTNGFSMNSALSSFLQSEINNITGNALKTLDLSVGLDNTTDASGTMHTDYSFKFAKRFWDNRLKVQIGGKVSSGQDAHNGQNRSFFDNVTMEYRLSPTSNQYVKLFYNQNVYDWLEGYTGEYGGGFIWRRRLDNFWDILRFWRKEKRNTRMFTMPRRERNDSIRNDTIQIHEAK